MGFLSKICSFRVFQKECSFGESKRKNLADRTELDLCFRTRMGKLLALFSRTIRKMNSTETNTFCRSEVRIFCRQSSVAYRISFNFSGAAAALVAVCAPTKFMKGSEKQND